MKAIIALVIALSALAAHAENDNNFTHCEKVEAMAVLAKDNLPYWAQVKNAAAQNCYIAVTQLINEGTDDQIVHFQIEHNNNIRVFKTDEEFAGFIQAHSDDYVPFTINYPEYPTDIPVVTPVHYTF